MSLKQTKILIFILLTFIFFLNDITSFQCSIGDASKTKLDFTHSDILYKLNDKFEIFFKAKVTTNKEQNWGIEFYQYIYIRNYKIATIYQIKIDLTNLLIVFNSFFRILDEEIYFSPNSNEIIKRTDKKYIFRIVVQNERLLVYQITNKWEALLIRLSFSKQFINNPTYIRFIGLNDNVKIDTEGYEEPLLCGGYLINDMLLISIHYDSFNGESGDIYNEEESIPSNSIKYLYLNFSSTEITKTFTIYEAKIDGKKKKKTFIKNEKR